MVRNLTQAEIDAIPRLKAQGYTTRGICKLFGVHQTAINYWVRRLNAVGHVIPKDAIGRPCKILINQTQTSTERTQGMSKMTLQTETSTESIAPEKIAPKNPREEGSNLLVKTDQTQGRLEMTQEQADALYYKSHTCECEDPDMEKARIDGWIDGVGIEIIN